MRKALETVVVVAAVLLAALLFREIRARAAARGAAAAAVGIGTTSDPPLPGTPPPVRAVQLLPPFKIRAQPRVLRTSAPPPPPTAN